MKIGLVPVLLSFALVGCGSGGPSGGAADRTPVLLIADQRNIFDLAVTDEHVFWGQNLGSNGTVSRISRRGGSAEVLFPDEPSAGSIRFVDGYLYWTVILDVRRAPLDELGTAALEAESLAMGHSTASMTVDATSLYFPSGVEKTIKKVPREGGSVTTFAGTDSAWRVAVWDGRVYWTLPDSGSVSSSNVDGSGFRVLATVEGMTDFVQADSDAVYFGADTGLFRVSPSGGAAEQLHEGPVGDIALDAESVFWAGSAGIWRLSKRGGEPELVVLDEGVWRIAVDNVEIFWISDLMNILKVPK